MPKKVSDVPAPPEGVLYQPEFLSESEEAELLREFERVDFAAFDFHGYRARRRLARYGVEYEYGTRQVSAAKPLPEFLLPVRDRAAAFAGVSPEVLMQGMILEYPPGAPIGWHRDAPQFGTILGISLLSAARMRLKPYTGPGKKQDESGTKDRKLISVILEPRSIYVLSGAARSEWQHSIPPSEKLRYSITFRTVREKRLRKTA